jgi:cytoskeletal protein CcmA (bactofilin family)
MFNRKQTNSMNKNKEPDHTALNLVGTGTTIKGEINSKGDIRVDGKIIGQVRSEGKIVVGNSGVIEGEVYCVNADISGKIDGKAEIGELLTLKASSIFTGDIITDKLAIEPGAKFSGTCSMDKQTASNPHTMSDKKK